VDIPCERQGKRMSNNLANVLGAGAALCSMSSFPPQLIKIWKERNASSVSIRMFLLTLAGFGLWLSYGFILGAWPLVASNIVCLAFCAAILHAKWDFRPK
jgi:MtN3 and saliva related transmembrane protein